MCYLLGIFAALWQAQLNLAEFTQASFLSWLAALKWPVSHDAEANASVMWLHRILSNLQEKL